MKSQDILLLLKIFSISCRERASECSTVYSPVNGGWQDWEDLLPDNSLLFENVPYVASEYSLRALEKSTGISKSQISLSLKRSEAIGLLKEDRKTHLPKVNMTGLGEFIFYGLKYVFPATPSEITRGIATGFSAPVLNKKIFSSGELLWVWPYAKGKTMGQMIKPIYKTVPFAVKQDEILYALLALVDAIRVGQSREKNLAFDIFNTLVKTKGRSFYE